jgi:hypothetical protein
MEGIKLATDTPSIIISTMSATSSNKLMDFLTKCEFEEGTYYEELSSQYCADDVKATSLSIDVENRKENMDTTHRRYGGMKLSKLNSQSPKMMANLTAVSRREVR